MRNFGKRKFLETVLRQMQQLNIRTPLRGDYWFHQTLDNMQIDDCQLQRAVSGVDVVGGD